MMRLFDSVVCVVLKGNDHNTNTKSFFRLSQTINTLVDDGGYQISKMFALPFRFGRGKKQANDNNNSHRVYLFLYAGDSIIRVYTNNIHGLCAVKRIRCALLGCHYGCATCCTLSLLWSFEKYGHDLGSAYAHAAQVLEAACLTHRAKRQLPRHSARTREKKIYCRRRKIPWLMLMKLICLVLRDNLLINFCQTKDVRVYACKRNDFSHQFINTIFVIVVDTRLNCLYSWPPTISIHAFLCTYTMYNVGVCLLFNVLTALPNEHFVNAPPQQFTEQFYSFMTWKNRIISETSVQPADLCFGMTRVNGICLFGPGRVPKSIIYRVVFADCEYRIKVLDLCAQIYRIYTLCMSE